MTDAERANILKATQLRDTLGEHDRALLHAVAPWVSAPQDPREVERRLVALTANHTDPDYLHHLCRFRVLVGNHAAAIDACQSARQLDPQLAAAVWLEGQSRLILGDTAAGTAVLDECLRISPGATACLNDFLQLTIRQGACDAAQGYVDRLIAIEPTTAKRLEDLGGIVYARGGSTADVHLAFDRWAKMTATKPSSAERAATRTRIAVLAGEIDEAAHQLEVWERGIASSNDELSHHHFAFAASAVVRLVCVRRASVSERQR